MLRSLSTSSIALIVGASPVFADLTPSQVWESLSKYYEDSGYTVTVEEETETADGLELSNVELSMDTAAGENGEASMKLVFPKLTFSEADNATVKSTFEGDATINSAFTPEGESPVAFDLTLSAPGNETISTGTPEDIKHEYNFPTLKVTMNTPEPISGENESTEGEIAGTVNLNELTGWTTIKQGENYEFAQDIATKAVDFDFTVTETPKEDAPAQAPDAASTDPAPEAPAEPTKVSAKGTIESLKAAGEGVMPVGQPDMAARMDKAIEAGLDFNGTFALGAMTGEFNVEASDASGAPSNGAGKFSSDGSDLTFELSKEGLSYAGNSKATNVEMTIPNLPFPITYAIEEASGTLAFPVMKSDEEQPFKVNYVLSGLTIGDGIWNMVDPQNKLPRDPANLTIDVDGQMKVNQNLFDPAMGQQALEAAGEPGKDAAAMPVEPFVPTSVKLNKIALDAVGASADVSGDLTIPEGAQQPVGKVNGTFNGINALIDKLVEMGFVPQDQVMGARMMMSMFAKPVDGDPDKLQSEIEFKEDGSIFANGQQIK